MRLLQFGENGELTITTDLVDEGTLPPYAILSTGRELEVKTLYLKT
jgi:hypothetical protein